MMMKVIRFKAGIKNIFDNYEKISSPAFSSFCYGTPWYLSMESDPDDSLLSPRCYVLLLMNCIKSI